MRLLAVLLLFSFLIPSVSADITAQVNQPYYNIGDSIDGSVSLNMDRNLTGSVKAILRCKSKEIPYFQVPVQAAEGFRTEVPVPEMKALSSMEGSCRLVVDVLDYDTLEIIETEESSSFTVSDGLEVALFEKNISIKPGSSLVVEGVVRSASGEPVNADVTVRFDEERYTVRTSNGRFLAQFGVSPGIPSGEHPLKILVEDGRGNKGSATASATVLPVPTRLKIDVGAKSVMPGGNITYLAAVYDQADDLMDASIDLHLEDPDGRFLFKRSATSGRQETYDISQFSPPGSYRFSASASELSASASFSVREVRDIIISRQGKEVVVENVGNVRYEDETTIILQGQAGNYLVSRDLDIGPGEVRRINLAEEVPEGDYNILLPDSASEAGSEIVDQELLAENVHLPDERGPVKKVTSGLGSVTANIVGADGVLVENSWIGPILLVLLIAGLTIHYGKGILGGLLRRGRP